MKALKLCATSNKPVNTMFEKVNVLYLCADCAASQFTLAPFSCSV